MFTMGDNRLAGSSHIDDQGEISGLTWILMQFLALGWRTAVV